MNKNYQKCQITNNELSLQVQNLSGNFSELIRTVTTMHEDLSMSLKMLEVKHINTSNNIKAIKESVKEINQKVGILNLDNPNDFQLSNNKCKKKYSVEKIEKKETRKKTDDFLYRQKMPKFPDSPEQAVREFRAITESENQSSQSKERYFNKIVPLEGRRDQRTDSFFSKNVKPMELFLEIPKNFDLDYLDESCLKTPKKVEGEKNRKKIQISDSSSSDENCHFLLKKKSHSNINIKNFDDFKMLLKDLKLTLNLSNYSTFNENFEENFCQLEKTLHDYNQLDLKIDDLFESNNKNEGSFADFLDYNSITEKQAKSVNNKPNTNYAIKQLNKLKNSTNFHLYENKLKELKNNPSEFESFFIKVKKELDVRWNKFREIETLFS